VFVTIILHSRKKKEKIESGEETKRTELGVVRLEEFEEETSTVQEVMDDDRVNETEIKVDEEGEKEKNLGKKSDERNIDENNNNNNINDDDKRRGSALILEFLEGQEEKKRFNLDVQKEESLLLEENKEKETHKGKGLDNYTFKKKKNKDGNKSEMKLKKKEKKNKNGKKKERESEIEKSEEESKVEERENKKQKKKAKEKKNKEHKLIKISQEIGISSVVVKEFGSVNELETETEGRREKNNDL
jgi:hypothetical protein